VSDDRTITLLEEIRDTQREHLAEYKRVTAELLEMQKGGLRRQDQVGGLYKRVILVGGLLVGALMILLVYVLVRWSGVLFR
jgi:hypothetical protein